MSDPETAITTALEDLGRKAYQDARPYLDQAMDLANMVYPGGARTVAVLMAQQVLLLVSLSVVGHREGISDEEALNLAVKPDSVLFSALMATYNVDNGPDPIAWAHDAFERVTGRRFTDASGPYAVGATAKTFVIGGRKGAAQ